MPKLQITYPDGREETHDLEAEVVTLGRLPDNMIQIDDASVSSHHAQFTQEGGEYVLKDLNSTNGTRRNGEQLSAATLDDTDMLRFGKIQAAYFKSVVTSAQPMPEEEELDAEVAQSSTKPADFTNASPFETREAKKTGPNPAIIGVAVVAILAFIGALVELGML